MTASENLGWRPPRRWPTRVYLFCLVTLSCFLVTMFVCGERAQLYVAALTVETPAAGETAEPSQGKTVREAILADENLLQVAADLGLQDPDDPADDQPVLATLRAGLRLHAAQGEALTIEYADPDATRAVAVARQIAERQAGAERRRAAARREQERRQLHERVETARDQREQAEARLQDFLDEAVPETEKPVTVFEFGQPGPDAEPETEGAAADDTEPKSGGALTGLLGLLSQRDDPEPDPSTADEPDAVLPGPTGIVVGPEDLFPQESPSPPDAAQDLNAQIEELVRQRDEMLQSMTTAHPQVREITKKIALLREQAAAAATAGGPPAGPGGPDAAAPPLSREQQLALLKEADSDEGRKYRALLEQVELAAVAVSQAEGAEQQTWQQTDDVVPLAAVGPLRQGLAWDPDRWLRLASMAIVLAGAVAMAVVLLAGAGETTYLSVEQAAGELPVPVVGVLSTGKPAGLTGPRLASWLARGIKLTCELGVVALVLWVVVLLARDRELLEQTRENPLSITSAAWQHTRQLLGH